MLRSGRSCQGGFALTRCEFLRVESEVPGCVAEHPLIVSNLLLNSGHALSLLGRPDLFREVCDVYTLGVSTPFPRLPRRRWCGPARFPSGLTDSCVPSEHRSDRGIVGASNSRKARGWGLPTGNLAGPRQARDSPMTEAKLPHSARPLIMSAAFSPIITEVAWVFPDVIVGMIDASATRKPSTPWTRRCASTTA